MTHVWLENPETGGKQQFSVESQDFWKGRGWQPCDPPEPVDLFHDPAMAEETPQIPAEEQIVEGEEPQEEGGSRTKSRRKTSAAAEE